MAKAEQEQVKADLILEIYSKSYAQGFSEAVAHFETIATGRFAEQFVCACGHRLSVHSTKVRNGYLACNDCSCKQFERDNLEWLLKNR